jgi:hypothetical protein
MGAERVGTGAAIFTSAIANRQAPIGRVIIVAMSLDDLQAQLRGALDQQFVALKTQYEQGIADARRQAEADAQRELQEKIEAARAEAEANLQSQMASARAEWETQLHAQVDAARAEGTATLRSQLEAARAEWEVNLRSQVDAARAEGEANLQSQMESARAEWQASLQSQMEAARAEWQTHLQSQMEAARADWETQLHAQVDAARAEGTATLRSQLDAARAEWELNLRSQVDATRAEGEANLRAQMEAARAEWDVQLRAQVDAARSEGERSAAEAAAQQQQTLDQAIASTRRSAELELESERRRAQKDVDIAREQAKAALAAAVEEERRRARAEIDALRQRMQAEAAAAAAPPAPTPAVAPAAPPESNGAAGRVRASIEALDATETLSQALEHLLQHAAGIAGRAAIFLINGDRLKPWKGAGIPDVDVRAVESSIGARDLLARAIQSGRMESSSGSVPAPPFARLTPDRPAVAAPLTVSGRPVAVLYADAGGDSTAAAGWPDAVEVIARHGSATIALRTAARTLDMLRGAGPDAGGEEGARRYARLLISEIKLYNEGAIRAGRQQRDLRQRLRAEIDRAQRLYEERVPPAIGARQAFFQQELVQTLADGDATLLGT